MKSESVMEFRTRVLAIRDLQVRQREFEQVEAIYQKLMNLQRVWECTSAYMLKELHEHNGYTLDKTVPHELQLALTYWGAVRHLAAVMQEDV